MTSNRYLVTAIKIRSRVMEYLLSIQVCIICILYDGARLVGESMHRIVHTVQVLGLPEFIVRTEVLQSCFNIILYAYKLASCASTSSVASCDLLFARRAFPSSVSACVEY
jgi:hypothetical protein